MPIFVLMVTFLHKKAMEQIQRIREELLPTFRDATTIPDAWGSHVLVMEDVGASLQVAPGSKVDDCSVMGTLIVEEDCVARNVVVDRGCVVRIGKGSTVIGVTFSPDSARETNEDENPKSNIQIGENSIICMSNMQGNTSIGSDTLMVGSTTTTFGKISIGPKAVLMKSNFSGANIVIGKRAIVGWCDFGCYCPYCEKLAIGNDLCSVTMSEALEHKLFELVRDTINSFRTPDTDLSRYVIQRRKLSVKAKAVQFGDNTVLSGSLTVVSHTSATFGDGLKVVQANSDPDKHTLVATLVSGHIRIGKGNKIIANTLNGPNTDLEDTQLERFSCIHTADNVTLDDNSTSQAGQGISIDYNLMRNGKSLTRSCRVRVSSGNYLAI